MTARTKLKTAAMGEKTDEPAPVPGSADRDVETGNGDAGPSGIVSKAFSILELVVKSGEPASTAEIVRLTGLTKPTVHRITNMLAEMGFIERDASRRGFVEGARLITLSLDTLAASAPRNLRHAVLRSVSETVGETCNFGILTGAEIVYLDRVEAKWPLGLRFEAGSRVPAHCTALGKLLVSQLPSRERKAAIANMPLTRYTGQTLTTRKAVADAIEAVRKSRIGIDNQEFIDGVVCVSVPVITPEGRVVGGIAISAPEARVTLERLLEHVPMMRDAANRLGATFAATTDGA